MHSDIMPGTPEYRVPSIIKGLSQSLHTTLVWDHGMNSELDDFRDEDTSYLVTGDVTALNLLIK